MAPNMVAPGTGPVRVIGKTISHYRVIEKLGGGGMSVVYNAEDTELAALSRSSFFPTMSHKTRMLLNAERESRAWRRTWSLPVTSVT
jgi:hypothetical protein